MYYVLIRKRENYVRDPYPSITKVQTISLTIKYKNMKMSLRTLHNLQQNKIHIDFKRKNIQNAHFFFIKTVFSINTIKTPAVFITNFILRHQY